MTTPLIAVFTRNRTNPAYEGARLAADRTAARVGAHARPLQRGRDPLHTAAPTHCNPTPEPAMPDRQRPEAMVRLTAADGFAFDAVAFDGAPKKLPA
jgi:hypothetical protein